MSGSRLREVREGGLLHIWFDHLPTRNSLDKHTRARLIDRLEVIDADPAIRVVILTGADPAFCSGVDAKQLLGDPHYTPLPTDPATVLRAMRTPTIAAVGGACISGGLEIALACSMIIASEKANFADTHARLGLVPGWGLSAELPAAIGVARARQLTLTGRPIQADTALQWGLVNEVVAHEELLARCGEIAEAISLLESDMVAHVLGQYRLGQSFMLAAARDAERQALVTSRAR